MRREEALEILKDVPLKFRTKDGTVVTIKSILEVRGDVLKFLDLWDKIAYITFDDINPPIIPLNNTGGK